MGLTNSSVGFGAVDFGINIKKHKPSDRVIAIAGNPNVGKSTLFNNLTGMNQHTGNWSGKTVAIAEGYCDNFLLVDIPGTYSLMANSAEEEVARNFICFGNPDATVVVCDATCLERNLNLVLQTIEICPNTVVCVNLLDEARRRHITVDLDLLSSRLGVPVVGVVARKKKSLSKLLAVLSDLGTPTPCEVTYCDEIETAVSMLLPSIREINACALNPRWIALRLLDGDDSLVNEMTGRYGEFYSKSALDAAMQYLDENGIHRDGVKDKIVLSLLSKADEICDGVVMRDTSKRDTSDFRIDRIITGRAVGYPLMLLLLALTLWITVSFANYPSSLLADLLFGLQDAISKALVSLGVPGVVHDLLVNGVYRVLAWVVSVMLPPMAIFFPLFTLLEDLGYLPRIAYNLDNSFRKCGGCGKQALTTCMGLGCNAAGVTGCRIIDSPRERLIAILTNNFVPCNGRFPAMITLIGVFFVGASGIVGSVLSALILTLVIVLGICITFATSALLSKTLLRGVPSAFTLELPPYRRPEIGKVVVRSVFDRTLFVLGRAVLVAAPAGALIWLMANITVGDITLLNLCANFFDPFARLIGLDGVIFMAFILGFPANEIVIPIALMAYMSNGTLVDADNVNMLSDVLISNGWTVKTALCTLIFSLCHWPCSTTVLTIKKETGSIKWTLVSILLPTLVGMLLCFIVNLFGNLV